MTAYVIANVDVHDGQAYEAYRSRTLATIEAHGGRFIVRGGEVKTLEGNPNLHRVVIIEFPSREAAQGWYDSPEYQAIIPLRTSTSAGALCIVEGIGE
ncbi:MAG TPA: DUF1330 domain-containing protein [Sphingomicrobium sp.]